MGRGRGIRVESIRCCRRHDYRDRSKVKGGARTGTNRDGVGQKIIKVVAGRQD